MIGCDFQYRDKIPVAVLGATGSVGQKFISLLSNHPWFEIKALAASERSAGKPYAEVVDWQEREPLHPAIGKMTVELCKPNLPCSVVFSGLDASVAHDIESHFAESGYCVISNCKNHRMDTYVPLLIPEVNPEHLMLCSKQDYHKGLIVTNPNCSVIGIAMALKPLEMAFGIKLVQVVTMQAVSGAGIRGRAEMDIEDNVIPFISGEEQKIEMELGKILGQVSETGVVSNPLKISAQCNRVPVSDGHMQCISVKLNNPATTEDILKVWNEYGQDLHKLKLPSAPQTPLRYFAEDAFPQPKKHRNVERGMTVCLGRLRSCPINDYKFVALSHNTIRGAAGGAILNAELMAKKGFIYW